MTYFKKSLIRSSAIIALATGIFLPSCSKTESYSELLREEEKAVNAFLAQKEVELEVPADSISFKTGEDAPFYKIDPDGYVYMQVIDKGDRDYKIKAGDIVYFRFERQNLKYLYMGNESEWDGNSDNLLNGEFYFEYKNTLLSNTLQYGTGIQMPLKFFGYNSEVNLVLKSYVGFQSDMTSCFPYIINIRYFKPEY